MSAVTGFMAGASLAFTPIQVDGLFIDGFAGGGGASTGIAQAIGRDPDIAVNHSETALAIHKANHPGTEHHCTDIRMPFLPKQTTRGRYVAGAWFSPDCKEFSKAKGGPVKDRSIRALCWEVIAWLKDVRPTCGYLENVEEFEYAAPLDTEGRPIAGAEGREFKRFVKAIRALGYRVQWKILIASHYGAPTSRKRLYMVMRNDGLPIVWPKATHGAPASAGVLNGKLLPYRTAAECIDWSIPCPSIFDRTKELVDATKRRVAFGVVRHVIEAAARGEAFIIEQDGVWAPHITKFRKNSAGSPADAEMPTVTANGQSARPAGAVPLGLVDAKLAPFVTYGQHGGANRPVSDPHHTIAASQKDTNGVVTAFMSRFYGSDKTNGGGQPRQPLSTTRAGGQHHAIVAAHLEQANGGPRNKNSAGRSAGRPLSTATTTGAQQRIVQTTMIEEGDLPPAMMERAVKVAAFLVKFYGSEVGQHQAVDVPLDCVTTKARFAVVTVTIDAKTYVIVDIGLRMLKPRELANAQGFPPNYKLNPIVRKFLRGKWVERELTIAEQISAIGNSVCPPVARALVAANQPSASASQPEDSSMRRAA